MRAFFILCCSLLCAAQAESEETITPQQADALYAWCDQLPIPSVKDLKPIRIWNDGPGRKIDRQTELPLSLGFLVEDREKEFRAISTEGAIEVFVKQGAQPGKPALAGYVEIPFAEEVREFLPKRSESENRKPGVVTIGLNYEALGWSSRLILLARWSEARGEHDLSLAVLRELQSWRSTQQTKGLLKALEIQLQEEFGSRLCLRAANLLAEKGVRRADVLESLRKIVALCPKAELKDENASIAVLERMVAEDAAYSALTDDQFAALLASRRADELAFRLRDECRHDAPPNADRLRLLRAADPSPSNGAAKALGDLGFLAVPALTKALDDDSFTREMGSLGSVLRVQDLALDLLCNISSCVFNPPDSFEFYPGGALIVKRGGERSGRFALAEAWGKGVSEKGEKDYLIECARTGDPRSELVQKLLDKYLDDAIPVLIECATTRPAVDDRTALAQLLWKREDPRCVAFLDHTLRNGPELGDRVAAAYAFRERRDPRGIAAMCDEWRRVKAVCGKSKWPEPEDDSSDSALNFFRGGKADVSFRSFNHPSRVVEFLAGSGATEAILSLAEGESDLPAEWRTEIIRRLLSVGRGKPGRIVEKPAPTIQRAIEDALVEFLGDTTPAPRTPPFRTSFWNGNPIIGPRVEDFAAMSMHALWPEKYAFDNWLPPSARSRQCIDCANIRAKESGEHLLPIPPEAKHEEPAPGAARKVVTVDCDSVPGNGFSTLAAKLSELRDQPLTVEPLISAFAAFAGTPLPPDHEFTVIISRFGDLSGIVIRGTSTVVAPKKLSGVFHGVVNGGVLFLGNDDSMNERDGSVVVYGAIEDPAHPQEHVHGHGPLARWIKPEGWPSLRSAIDEALAKPPRTAFLIAISFTARSQGDHSVDR
ncbi:MAG TPA: hypothetical protein VGH90_01210 [Chthoniobacteraceae bacterium]|jgi:hypothetical protein